MIVVYPYEIAIIDLTCYSFGEKAVGFAVSFPVRLVKRDFSGMVMEQRPEDRVYDVGQQERDRRQD